jgi:hypothetical protein
MPLDVPSLDNRRYQDLLSEALARIPVHTPEWTNYAPSDPGRTLVELFCFLTENLLYRANQIPDRNRRKFLQLLGVPLQSGSAARGIVTFTNRSGPLETVTLNADLEVRAGEVPFQTKHALDVLPLEGRVYYKRRLANTPPRVADYYRLLYASYKGEAPPETFAVELYETVPLDPDREDGIDLGSDAVDASLWVALIAPPNVDLSVARKAIEGKTLSLGIVPALRDGERRVAPSTPANAEAQTLLRYEMPAVPASGALPADPLQRVAHYKAREPRPLGRVLEEPAIVELTLPAKGELELWADLDPLEAGVGDFPPALDETSLRDRVVTWLRVRAASGAHVRLLWLGINAVTVMQRARISNETLQPGTGVPDQTRQLARAPVVEGSVVLQVSTSAKPWKEIDDLLAAGPEVQVPDPRSPPGAPPPVPKEADVFCVDYEAGLVRFGDGLRGRRPPEGAILRATYDYSLGAEGNVAAGAISSGPALPSGYVVSNPLRTWGGADPETVAQGEKQIGRYLQHRDRLVTVDDFQSIARRAPGVDIGRLEVLPAFHPELSPNEPGDAPGVVTLMVVPRHDAEHPKAPQPDSLFLNALCRYLDARRLVTTELVLRGPHYVPIYVSVGIDIKAGHAVADVREAVKQRLLAVLAPVYADADVRWVEDSTQDQGWPLRKAVLARELMAEASRIDGVQLVNDVLLAKDTGDVTEQVPMTGLQLPQVVGISVQAGTALALDALRGRPTDALGELPPTSVVPLPFVPEEC